jgi:hypothetical protein
MSLLKATPHYTCSYRAMSSTKSEGVPEAGDREEVPWHTRRGKQGSLIKLENLTVRLKFIDKRTTKGEILKQVKGV